MQKPSGSLSSGDLLKVVDQVLTALKQQSDRKQFLSYRGTVDYNPQVLSQGNPTILSPSYPFFTVFKSAPAITFGQTIAAYAGVNQFFIVQPYVASWVSDSGGIKAFNLGVYALTPVPANLTNHTIMYHVSGKASTYKDVRTTPNWNQAYDQNAATHLIAQPGTLETK